MGKRFLLALALWCGMVGAGARADERLDYGQFSVSLNVKDIKASHAFYTKLGFRQVAGDLAQNWAIMSNDSAVIGIFQGHFQGNIMTFNPADVRGLHRALKNRGVAFDTEPQGTSGPAFATFKDPDGNIILLDQHK